MYMKRMVEIGQAENGFVLECRVPIKPKKKSDSKELCCDYPGSSEKQYIAKDTGDVIAILSRLLPMLDDEYTSEDEFDATFDKVAD